MRTSIILLILFALVSGSPLFAQEAVSVPNVIGLTVPRATAILNRAGLGLGSQSLVTWTPDSAQAASRIDQQSPAPGEAVEPGARIDVTVFGSPSATIVYDDNDLTVVNLTNVPINMGNVAFSALDGASASYAASRWANNLEPGKCFQIWAVSRSEPKIIDGCSSIQNWRWTGNTGEHFWTTSSGVSRFSVTDGGIQQAVCNAAPPGSETQPLRCDISLAGGSLAGQATDYVYFAYTPESFVFVNQSTDQWMPTEQTTIYNYNPGLSAQGLAIHAGDPALYGNPFTVADIRRLAPGQCLLFTSENPDAVLPTPCEVVARLSTSTNLAFWLASFQVSNSSDDEVRRNCPAAEPDKTVVCILPR
jgi:hypothetical protein